MNDRRRKAVCAAIDFITTTLESATEESQNPYFETIDVLEGMLK
jgi:putative N-acetylmannosamine-6-phosphate epimerase